MAIVEITKELLFQFIQEKLLLPNPVDDLVIRNHGVFEISTKVEGYGENAHVVGVYQIDKGKVKLSRIERVE